MGEHLNENQPLCHGEGPFRENAAALIVRRRAGMVEVLLGERQDTPGAWQWPQGGVDPGETPQEAVVREVCEEVGVQGAAILYRFPEPLTYYFPLSLYRKFKPNVGQRQWYFLLTLEPGDEPDLTKASCAEFHRLCWRSLEEAVVDAIWFKREVYQTAVRHALEVLNAGQVSL